DLVDDDDLRHVVLHRLDHHRVLQLRPGHLHPPRPADPGMGDVAIPGDLVAGVDHHYPLATLVSQDAGHLAQHGRLADARFAQQQKALTADHDVADDLHPAGHRPAHPAGQADDLPSPIADGADPVQGAGDPGTVVPAEVTHPVGHVGDVLQADRGVAEDHLTALEARLRLPAQVEDNL